MLRFPVDGIISIDDIQLYMLLFADDAVLFTSNPITLQSMLLDIERYEGHSESSENEFISLQVCVIEL